MLATCARLEDLTTRPNAVAHRVVEADVEVQKRVLFEAAPVAAEQSLWRVQVKGARDDPAVFLGDHQLDGIGHRRKGPVKKILGQLHGAP